MLKLKTGVLGTQGLVIDIALTVSILHLFAASPSREDCFLCLESGLDFF
jgi:hypothetical protein